MVFHIELNTAVLPVKCTPPKLRSARRMSVIVAALPGTKLMTPGGRPASCRICKVCHAERIAVPAGFQMVVHPISAGAVGRLAPIAVKLNGEMAYTNPSRPR